MPEELVFLSALAIVCGTGLIVGIAWMIINYLHHRSGTRQAEGASLTESQLRRLVQEAVGEALRERTEPLVERIAAVEHRLPEREGQRAISAADDDAVVAR